METKKDRHLFSKKNEVTGDSKNTKNAKVSSKNEKTAWKVKIFSKGDRMSNRVKLNSKMKFKQKRKENRERKKENEKLDHQIGMFEEQCFCQEKWFLRILENIRTRKRAYYWFVVQLHYWREVVNKRMNDICKKLFYEIMKLDWNSIFYFNINYFELTKQGS